MLSNSVWVRVYLVELNTYIIDQIFFIEIGAEKDPGIRTNICIYFFLQVYQIVLQYDDVSTVFALKVSDC